MCRGGQLLIVFVALVLATGCVQRRLTIRSNPPGAFVWVDNYPIGTTPVSTDFTYYGKRQIRLVRDGYETLTVEQKIKAPWYEWFGIDFISENLVPANIRDEQTLDFNMVPQQVPSSPQLQARAEELRASSQAQRYVPPMPVVPPPGAVPPPPPPGTIMPQQTPPPGLLPPPTTGAPMMLPPPQTAPQGQAPVSDGWQAPGASTAPPPSIYAPPPGAYAPPPGTVAPLPGAAIPPPNLVTPPAAPPSAAPTLPIR